MKTTIRKNLFLSLFFINLIVGFMAYLFFPRVQMRVDQVRTWVRGWVMPTGELPVAEGVGESWETTQPLDSTIIIPNTVGKVSTVSESSVSLPAAYPQSVILPSPVFDLKKDYQDWNNCGPATLALGLRFWGWKGDQFTISDVVRPERQDKNVNIEELAGYVNKYATGLQAEIRVGGDLTMLKKLIAGGFPVIIEKSFKLEKAAWPGDDLWAGHYLLITGYDDEISTFTGQDSYFGPDRMIGYDDLTRDWQSFNHVFLIVFPKDRMTQVKLILGADWQAETNVRRVADSLQMQLNVNKGNAFVWFNLGSNLLMMEEYEAAASAFQTARKLGLPQRMLRYQFGPFVANYQIGDTKDLEKLVDYSLKITPDSEEALLWKGWGLFQSGDKQGAITFFRKALEANQGYQDAINALMDLNSL